MLKADLHTHSTYSDGSDTIEQIVAAAEKKGLDAVALTEHDTLAHLDEIARIAKRAGVAVIGGIEISAVDPDNGLRAHILGYRVKDAKTVAALTQPLLEARNRNSQRQAEILRENGYALAPEALALADGKYLYKQHIMDHLVKTGQAPEMFGDFYRTIFKNGGICDFDIAYIDACEAVRTIKQAGGLAVLAHAGQQQNFYLIPKLVQNGLDGLELYHHANSETDQRLLAEYARKYGLFLTGGSDYHGRYEPQNFGVGDIISHESGVVSICFP